MDDKNKITFHVTITTNASKHKYKREAALGLLRAISSRFHPENVSVKMGKSEIKYDALADDGHHAEHSKTLQLKKPDKDWEEWV